MIPFSGPNVTPRSGAWPEPKPSLAAGYFFGSTIVFDDPSGALYLAYHSWTAEGRVLSISPLLLDGPLVGAGGDLKPWHRGRVHTRF